MSTNSTADFRSIYYELERQVVHLHVVFNQIKELYLSQDVVALLTDTASGFFGVLQTVLMDDVLMSIGRLTDEPKVGKYKTLSLKTMAKMLEAIDPQLKVSVDASIQTLDTQALYVREHRDWRIAHSDYDAVPGINPVKQISDIEIQQIEGSLTLIDGIMNSVHEHIAQGSVGFEHSRLQIGDARDLVSLLRQAKKYRDLEYQRLSEGLPPLFR